MVVRLDSDGDVLLSGPAVRAASAAADEVTLLCGPAGAQAAGLLPGVDRVLRWECPWIAAEPPTVDRGEIDSVVDRVAGLGIDTAVILTSFHQSSLPTALLLRMAGVPRVVGISEDYPGSLLDVRVRPDIDFQDDAPEPERALAVMAAAGFRLPASDDGSLRVRETPDVPLSTLPYVVVHPGATAPSRTWSPDRWALAVRLLTDRGTRVVVTGSPAERDLTAFVAGEHAVDLGGHTTYPELAAVLSSADAVVVGNTGPAHLAAAVGTPVVSLFSPVVPAARWAPYGVPVRLLGDQSAPCRGTRARECPIPGHPCLDAVPVEDVVRAVDELAGVAA